MSFSRDNSDAKASTPRVIRRIGFIEHYNAAQHFLGFYYSCAVTCKYVTPTHLIASSAISIQDIFEQALALAILEHPLLQVGLADEASKRPSWVQLQSIDLKKLVHWQTVADQENNADMLLNILQEQHSSPFQELETRPLWRMVVWKAADLTSLEVVFTWNHAAADGMSGKIFHRSLLENLCLVTSNQTALELDDHMIKLPTLVSLTPRLEEILKFPVSPRFVASEAWKAVRPLYIASRSPYPAAWSPMRPLPYRTRLQLVEVQNDAVQALLLACRVQKTTITGLIHALALISFATRLGPNQARAFVAGTPFDLRRFIPSSPPGHPGLEPHRTAGNFVANFEYKFDAHVVSTARQKFEEAKINPDEVKSLEKNIWSIARAFREGMSKRLEAGTKNNVLGLSKVVGNMKDFLRDSVKEPREVTWEVSNLGVLDNSGHASDEESGKKDWMVDRAIFSQSATVCGPAYIFNPATVRGGGLAITCCWQQEIVDETLAIGVANDLQTWLDDMGTGTQLTISKA